MTWLPGRRAAWVWAGLLPLLWVTPVAIEAWQALSPLPGSHREILRACIWAAALLPLFAGAPWGWTVRPVGILGWLWLAANIFVGLAVAALIGLVVIGVG